MATLALVLLAILVTLVIGMAAHQYQRTRAVHKQFLWELDRREAQKDKPDLDKIAELEEWNRRWEAGEDPDAEPEEKSPKSHWEPPHSASVWWL